MVINVIFRFGVIRGTEISEIKSCSCSENINVFELYFINICID